jgi:GNAT superfamily N-acetyltransferase
MAPIKIAVTKLPLSCIRDAAQLLARAFYKDPIITFFLNDPIRRKVAFPAFFRALLCESWECGHTYAALAGKRLIGVSVWIPPTGARPSRRFLQRAERNHSIVKARFPRRAPALYAGFEATLKLHPDKPHWYLFFIGVEPSFQHSGVGRSLIAPVLDAADRDGKVCYLETPFRATHEFYRGQGFELRPATRPFEGAPELWTMVRASKAACAGKQECP